VKEWPRPEITESKFIRRPATRGSLNKFLLAITLIVAFSAPALAALGKTQGRPDQRHVESASERQWKVGNAQRRLNGRQVSDPYWYTPCNNSSSPDADDCE
jgi:hypothetical protein